MRVSKWFWLGALALLACGVVIYRASLDVGFWTDDYSFLEMAGRLAFPDYIRYYFDPFRQSQWYRPLHGMMWWIVYVWLGKEPFGYHLAQVLIHLANVLLLYGLVARVTRHWRTAFLAALVYLSLPAYLLAVNWPGVADPLAGLFSLLAIWFWLDYLESDSVLRYITAILAVVGALLSKEIGVALPFTLFLVDRWLISKPARLSDIVRRYAIFLLILPLYALFEFTVVTQGVFTRGLGYSVGTHILEALVLHLGTLTFPWGLPAPFIYAWLFVIASGLVFAIVKRRMRLLFLAATAMLAVLPVLPLPIVLAQASRYLYVPLMASAIAAGGLFQFIVSQARPHGVRWAGVLGLAILVTLGAGAIGDESVNFAGAARQVRLQFRPIFQQHATVEPNTLMYFIQPPFPTPNISGVMFQRYGANVNVYGTDRDQMPDLRSYRATWIYYPDEHEVWQEQAVDKNATVSSMPAAPVRYGDGISLESWQLASANVKPPQAIVLVLYWKNVGKIAKDYTVFTHLVNGAGERVAGYDAQPRQGYSPTSRWRTGERLADSAIIPIDGTLAPGEYTLELGLYDPVTMERLSILDASGRPVSDKLVIEHIRVGE